MHIHYSRANEKLNKKIEENFKQIMFITEASNSVADSTQLLHYSFAVVVEYCTTCNFSCYFSGQVWNLMV